MTERDDSSWHKCQPLFPKRTIEGHWTAGRGQVWRRKVEGKWQHRQDPETWEDVLTDFAP